MGQPRFSEGSNIVDTQVPEDFVPPAPVSLLGVPAPLQLDPPEYDLIWTPFPPLFFRKWREQRYIKKTGLTHARFA
jgi:hypothetical protein